MSRVLVLVLTALLIGTPSTAAVAGDAEEPSGKEKPLYGCTPGYWKNHTEQWEPFEPDWTYDTLAQFELPPSLYGVMADDTLLDILQYHGGPGYDGAARIMLRHAMAALLNNQHPGVAFTLTRHDIVPMVNEALASLDREKMLEVKAVLEFLNEQECPL